MCLKGRSVRRFEQRWRIYSRVSGEDVAPVGPTCGIRGQIRRSYSLVSQTEAVCDAVGRRNLSPRSWRRYTRRRERLPERTDSATLCSS